MFDPIFEAEEQRPISDIHIRLKQRTARKSLTYIEGLAEDLDLEKICRYLKKTLRTNGAVIDKTVIQLSGDQRVRVKTLLKNVHIWDHPDPIIKLHGA